MTPDTYTLTCPECGFTGGDRSAFDRSMADECFCPECGYEFMLEYDDDED